MNQNPKTQKGFISLLMAIVISIVIASGISYGAIEYQKASKLIKEAKQLTKEEKYTNAIEKLEFIQNRWLIKNLGIKKQEIANEIERNKKLLEDKTVYTQGIEEFNRGNLERAKELLSRVSELSPYFENAKNKIKEAELKIEKEKVVEVPKEEKKVVEVPKEEKEAKLPKATPQVPEVTEVVKPPLPCNSKEECERYCSENPQICEEFCKNNPNFPLCIRGPESETPVLSIPFDIENIDYTTWVMWPFCVHGGDHPEGHGGIDFDLKPNTKIYASCDGRVEMVKHEEREDTLTITCGRIAVNYNGLTNIRVKEGDMVKRGDWIAETILFGNDHYIHFETVDFLAQKLKCPYHYVGENFKKLLEDLIQKAKYLEKSTEPNICNCEELPYKETMVKQ